MNEIEKDFKVVKKLAGTYDMDTDEFYEALDNIIAFVEQRLNSVEKFPAPKIAEEIKGVEVNNDFYQEFVKRHVRVNEGIPMDEVRMYYNDGNMRIFKIK